MAGRFLVPRQVPAGVERHFGLMLTPNEAVPLAEDLYDEMQRRLTAAAGFPGLSLLGAYTEMRRDGVMLIVAHISTADLGSRLSLYEAKAISEILRRQYKAFSRAIGMFSGSPFVSMTFAIKPRG
jgi:hypothetical protein